MIAEDTFSQTKAEQAADTPVLEVKDLKVEFPITRGFILKFRAGGVKAVDGISFSIKAGETLGLVGESGSGKSTTANAVLQLQKPTSGSIKFDGVDLSTVSRRDVNRLRRQIGFVFQDPFDSLNPRMNAERIIGEPLRIHDLFEDQEDYLRQVTELIEIVGLNAAMTTRFPHEFSGGQRQRIAVARGIAARPKLIILDEPVSALDVSIQAQIINLLKDLQDEFNLAYLFIAHDLSVVRHIADNVAVMYLGKIMEIASRDILFDNARHPYTQALISAVPLPDPILERQRQRMTIEGDIPSPANPPPGCVFNTRCPFAIDQCSTIVPELRDIGNGQLAACIRAPGYGPSPDGVDYS